MLYPPHIRRCALRALILFCGSLLMIRPVLAQDRAYAVGRVPMTAPVSFALALPLRNRPALQALLRRLYDPQNSAYHHFLTPAQFDAEFGPSPQDYQTAAAYAQAQGLSVTGTTPSRLLLDVSGPAASVERAFGVGLTRYVTGNGRVFRAPDAAPALPSSLTGVVSGVVGLDTAAVRRPDLRRIAARPAAVSNPGSGPGGGLSPMDIKAAYGLDGVALDGGGQTLAVFELDGYSLPDVRAYESYYGLPQIPLTPILVDGVSGIPGSGADEATLDIELASAIAVRAEQVMVYEAPNTDQGIIDGYTRIADDDQAQEISTSWGFPEDQTSSATLNAEDSAFAKMAAQGQSMFSATGDNGAYDDGNAYVPGTTTLNPTVDDPGSQPYVTSVGGTTLSVNGVGGTFASESVWNDDTVNSDGSLSGNGAGGGGVSGYWNLENTLGSNDYQQGLTSGGSPISATMRNVPDISLNADPNTGYSIYFGGRWVIYGGTSTAAPVWAGFTALVNQQRALLGTGPIGFINPAIYAIGKGQTGSYSQDFHDVTSGNNLYYSATSGYDLATGWGSFNGAFLLADLAGSPTPTQSGPFTFPAGWNFFSLPYDDSSVSPDTVFGYPGVSLDVWDPASSRYLVTPTPPADALRLGVGYWADFPHTVTAQANGLAADATQPFRSLAVSAGWNQIGVPFLSPIALANVQFTDAAGTRTSFLGAEEAGWISGILYRYDSAIGSYTPLSEGALLQPGLAYWLYATQALTVQIPPP